VSLGYVDGRVVPLAEATVPLTDRGYLLGDGLFETMRAQNGHVFRLEEHAARLRHGLHVLGLDEGLITAFRDAVGALVTAADPGELYLRVHVTTGPFRDVPGMDPEPAVTGLCRPLAGYPGSAYAGLRLVTSAHRKDRRSPLSTVKHMSYLPHVLARRQAIADGADDALLLNEAGRAAEATTANVIAFRDGVAYAPGPGEGALEGVTRGVLLATIAEAAELRFSLPLDVLAEAEEAVLTNTSGGAVPVTRLDEAAIGDGRPGPWAGRLRDAYLKAVEEETR